MLSSNFQGELLSVCLTFSFSPSSVVYSHPCLLFSGLQRLSSCHLSCRCHEIDCSGQRCKSLSLITPTLLLTFLCLVLFSSRLSTSSTPALARRALVAWWCSHKQLPIRGPSCTQTLIIWFITLLSLYLLLVSAS
jgi:hypothetical protein